MTAEQPPMLPGMPAGPAKKKPNYYTLHEGTTMFYNPWGIDNSGPKLEEQATVVVLTERSVRGFGTSLRVEVTKPPHLKGQSFWIAPRGGKGKGFL